MRVFDPLGEQFSSTPLSHSPLASIWCFMSPTGQKPLPPKDSAAPPPDDDVELDEQDDLLLPEMAEPETEASPDSVERGAAVIKRFWKTLPNSPGVYRMLDGAGEVLYVGKARRLKARVASYARGQGHSNRISRMIAETASMEFVVTTTETEALLLETNYIKQFRPRFNVLMRDDKSFPYILLTGDHDAPQLAKHRGARNRKGDYYGPFASAWAVKRTIDALQKAFLIRTCTDSYYANRSRPCLLHQIKRCAAPCTGEISIPDYAALIGEAKGFLSGRSKAVKDAMAAEMQSASDALEFEKAARFRDRIAALSSVTSSQDVSAQGVEEADVFAIAAEAGQFCVEVYFFRMHQNWGNRAFFPKADPALSPADVLDAFIAQFYDDKPVPKQILISEAIENADLLSDAFSARVGHKVDILAPQRGEKRSLIDHALRNATEELTRKLADVATQTSLLASLAKAFDLPAPPRRIEVYDNSHISGTNAVGAMIVAGAEGFRKQHYRTFNIRNEDLSPGDDFGMMREVLHRRFSRLMKDADRETAEGAFPDWPDLVLIDGGQGQLSAAEAIFAELGVSGVTLAGVAKGADREAGRETFFKPGKPPFRLPPRDPTLYFIQRLRDEAHRFAIGTHRAKRRKDLTRSPLDDIAGIGPTRKRALLLHFGTAKAIQRASLDDLMRTPGVNAATAQAVYDYFHESG
jgi:excinuclease ABC subunit C